MFTMYLLLVFFIFILYDLIVHDDIHFSLLFLLAFSEATNLVKPI
jgi:hypothetical protein